MYLEFVHGSVETGQASLELYENLSCSVSTEALLLQAMHVQRNL